MCACVCFVSVCLCVPMLMCYTSSPVCSNPRLATRRLLERGAKHDDQQEELSIYMAESEDLEDELRRRHRSHGDRAESHRYDDEVVKMLHRKRAAHLAQFLCGSAKRRLVEQRRAADSRLREQYYGYRF